jgi:glycosyltransferase involved in cell wall biosynthesis
MNKNLSVTIGIPAYNEEDGIKTLLESVASQIERGYKIMKIIVISDGSTDSTVRRANEVKDKRVQVINSKTNKGRIARRNELIKMADTEIFIFIDADGYLEKPQALSLLLKAFNDDKVMLASGNPLPTGNNSFLNKSLMVARNAYRNMRYQYKLGNNIYSCFGSMLAIKKKLYTSVQIPTDIDADDAYIYFSCISSGYKFKNVKSANAVHLLPQDLATHIKRNTRHEKSNHELKKYFGELVNKEYAMPKNLYIKAVFKQFAKYPVHSTFIYIVNTYTRIQARRKVRDEK